ncbi:hypothetical protein QJS04_geneDACA012426 [Acorus gramineus]|uniref:CCHC-type domain-containing protein n=1 Tax=Acorus gramineus TaxID=55184 RepID=A0AAV9B9Q9_ACOGR|nr:hypothetical protein QJS04_geneDACA012426 [Acorus gramineus]
MEDSVGRRTSGGTRWPSRRQGGRCPKGSCCFRCLGLGHWRRECREPVICLRCRGTGHRAFTCPLDRVPGSQRVTAMTDEALELQLGDSFKPYEEERSLRCCVVVTTSGWSPPSEELTRLVEDRWGKKDWAVDRVLGPRRVLLKVTDGEAENHLRRGGLGSLRGVVP